MTAYLVGHVTVKKADLWAKYVAGVQESLAPYAAKVIFRGLLDSVLAGDHKHESVVVIEFTDQATLEGWFNSDLYQSLIPLRYEAADVVITSYEPQG